MRRALAFLALAGGILVSSAVVPSPASARLSVPEIVDATSPAVASIYAYDERDNLIGQGAGFFVSQRGEIVTNFRVLRRAQKVVVKTASGETLTVRGMVAQNEKFELVKLVVGVRAPTSSLKLANRLPEEGQRVVVVGGPGGASESAPKGWVSAVRDVPGFGSLVQITVPGSRISNGSPIVDEDGLVVGVVSVMTEADDVHLAVPAARIGEMRAYSWVVPIQVWSVQSPSMVGTVSLSVDRVSIDEPEAIDPVYHRDPHELLAAGVEAYFQGRYEEAVLALRSSLKLKPHNPDAYYTLGMAYEALGYWKDALAAYKETVRLDPTYTMAYNAMGLALGSLDRWKEAEAALKEALRLTPTLAEAHANLGVTYRHLGRLAEAKDAYRKAIGLRPDYAEAHFALGVVYEKLDEPAEAMYAFEQAVKFRPDYSPAYSRLGAIYLRLGQREKGMEVLLEALRLDPTDGEAMTRLGVVYGQLGRYNEEVSTLERAVRYEPFYWEAHSSLGVAYWRGGRAHDALVEFKRALRLKPDNSTAHFYLGLIYFSLGNQGGAMHQYRVLATLDRAKAGKLYQLIDGRQLKPTS